MRRLHAAGSASEPVGAATWALLATVDSRKAAGGGIVGGWLFGTEGVDVTNLSEMSGDMVESAQADEEEDDDDLCDDAEDGELSNELIGRGLSPLSSSKPRCSARVCKLLHGM